MEQNTKKRDWLQKVINLVVVSFIVVVYFPITSQAEFKPDGLVKNLTGLGKWLAGPWLFAILIFAGAIIIILLSLILIIIAYLNY